MMAIWNTFCADVKKKKGSLEMKFEASVVRGFLHELGWSIYSKNLKEQVGIYNGKDRSDFFLHVKNHEDITLMIVELKKPEHKQKSKDIDQIERYMKVYGCRFGIYLGEKLEVFYRVPDGDNFKAASVTSIDYTPDNKDAEQLLNLIKYDQFDKEKLNQYCLDQLEVNKYIDLWQTPEGSQGIYDAIIEKFKLSSTVISKLRSILKFNVDTSNVLSKEIIVPQKKEKKSEGSSLNDNKIESFKLFAQQSVTERTAQSYVRHLKNRVRQFINQLVNPNDDSVFGYESVEELKSCLEILYNNEEFKNADKKNNRFYSASLNKYLLFMESRENPQGISRTVKRAIKSNDKNHQETWIICYDKKYFNVDECFKKYGQVYWRHKDGLINVRKGDILYLWANRPESAVRFKAEVIESNIPYSTAVDEGNEFLSPEERIKSKDFKHFLVRPIAVTHSPALKHEAMMKSNVIGKRPSTTMLSKEKYKSLKDYIEIHFNEGKV